MYIYIFLSKQQASSFQIEHLVHDEDGKYAILYINNKKPIRISQINKNKIILKSHISFQFFFFLPVRQHRRHRNPIL